MVEITKEELINISGGKAPWAAIGVVVSIVATLLAGIIDGYFRPLTCNK